MNFKVCVCVCMHFVCLCVCVFDKVHDEYMHECVTVVMRVYAKQGKNAKGGGRRSV